MNSYDGSVVDQYMRSVLAQDLNDDEIDNAMTLLSTLTTVAAEHFPPEHTVIRVHRVQLKFHPEIVKAQGVIVSVLKDGDEKRTLHIPRPNLSDLETAMDAMFFVLRNGHLMSDDDYEA